MLAEGEGDDGGGRETDLQEHESLWEESELLEEGMGKEGGGEILLRVPSCWRFEENQSRPP